MDWDTKSRNSIDSTMRNLYHELSKLEDEIFRLGDFINSSGQAYSQAEDSISKLVGLDTLTINSSISSNENSDTTTDNYLFKNFNLISNIKHLLSFFSRIGQITADFMRHEFPITELNDIKQFYLANGIKINNISSDYIANSIVTDKNPLLIQSTADPMVQSYLTQIIKDLPALDNTLNMAPYSEEGRLEQIKKYLRNKGYDVPYTGGLEPKMFNTLNYLRGSNQYVFEKITSTNTQLVNNNETAEDEGWFSWVDDVGDWIGDRAQDVSDWYVDNHIGEYLYTGVEIVGGVATTVVSAGGIFFSSGTAVPAYVSLAHGVNSVYNGIQDIKHINNNDFKSVGSENLFRDHVYKPTGKMVGSVIGETVDIGNMVLGNETNYSESGGKLGESIGELGYYGVDIFGGASGIKSSVNAMKTKVTHLTSTYYYVEDYINGFKRMNDLKIVETPSNITRLYEATSIMLNSSGIFYNLKSFKNDYIDNDPDDINYDTQLN